MGEKAVNRRACRLVVHIGQHKTGSKALQSFLAHNQVNLRARGILYPADDGACFGIRAYAISQFRLYALIRREAIAECHGTDSAAAYWNDQAHFCAPFDSALSFFEALDAEVRQSRPGQVVISAEDLFDMHTAHETVYSPGLIEAGARQLAWLASKFGYDVRVVVYVRRQDHLLGAHYVQFIKGSPHHDIDFDEFSRAFAPRLDTHAILTKWVNAFGADRVQVRRYEPDGLPGGIVADFFNHVLGLPVPAACDPPAADTESVNRTPGRDFVEFIRILNRRAKAGQSVFARDAVLEASQSASRTVRGESGIAAWLSPTARSHLLDLHREGNAAIAREFLGCADGRLFDEPAPESDQGWEPYSGFSPELAMAVALMVHEVIVARRCPGVPPKTEINPVLAPVTAGAATLVHSPLARRWSGLTKLHRKVGDSFMLLRQRRAGC
jgi:hypothetical protein